MATKTKQPSKKSAKTKSSAKTTTARQSTGKQPSAKQSSKKTTSAKQSSEQPSASADALVPSQVAKELGVDGRVLHAFLRERGLSVGRGKRYAFSRSEADRLKKQFRAARNSDA